jgi:hypothetical protein
LIPEKKNKIILEIGGGYGGLANKLINNFSQSKFLLIDLPENLLLQYYYLTNLHPTKKIYFINTKEELNTIKNYDVLLLTPFNCSTIIDDIYFDIIIQTRGFGEMNRISVNDYFHLIQKNIKEGGILYLVERYVGYRGEEVMRIRDYPFDKKWSTILSHPTWLSSHGHDFLLERTTNAKYDFTEVIKSLPLISPPPDPITKNYNIMKWTQDNNFPDKDFL